MPPLLKHLIECGLLTAQQAAVVMRRQQRTNQPTEQVLQALKFCPQERLFRCLAEFYAVPYCDLSTPPEPSAAAELLPARLATQFHCVPVSNADGTLQLAFSRLPDSTVINQLRLLGIHFEVALATPEAVDNRLSVIYGPGAGNALQLQQRRMERFGLPAAPEASSAAVAAAEVQGEDESSDAASVPALVNSIIADAISRGATDLHIEPFEKQLNIRLRIDGMLRTVATPPEMRPLLEPITARLKVMAALNIAEKRLPQDGRLQFSHNGRIWNLRLSVLPSRYGETVCLRILPAARNAVELSGLGLNPRHLALLKELAGRTHGLVLVTGPTGSGKTTTLYSVLSHLRLHHPELKIITVEDPVEYDMPGITQLQTHAEIGLTFSVLLRSILRHDPDVLLIGEIRDRETAEIAIQSAITGHLVFSTLHTNDSIGAVNRLVNMGTEPDLVASSLNGVVAQRLVRRLCPHCAVPADAAAVPPGLYEELRACARAAGLEQLQLRRPADGGCSQCGGSGYHGRIAIYEFFEIDDQTEDRIAAGTADSQLRRLARDRGMATFRDDGLLKAAQGLTSIDEVLRVTAGKH